MELQIFGVAAVKGVLWHTEDFEIIQFASIYAVELELRVLTKFEICKFLVLLLRMGQSMQQEVQIGCTFLTHAFCVEDGLIAVWRAEINVSKWKPCEEIGESDFLVQVSEHAAFCQADADWDVDDSQDAEEYSQGFHCHQHQAWSKGQVLLDITDGNVDLALAVMDVEQRERAHITENWKTI